MTTPNQVSPDGAIVIGGGTWNYGQTLDESVARAAFEFPMPTPTNMIDLLRIALEGLPIDALKPFANFLGLVDGVFDNIADAVNQIVGSLVERVFQTVEDFGVFLNTLFTNPGQLIGNLFDVVMDGIHSIGDFLKRLWDGLTGNSGTTAVKTVDNVATAAGTVRATAGTASSNAGTALTNLQTGWNDLFDGFGGTTGSTGQTSATVRTRGATVRATAITADGNATTAISNAATAQSTANTGVSNAAAAQSTANTGVANAGTAQTTAVAAQGTADDSASLGLSNAADILVLKSAQTGGSNSGYSATDTFSTVAATLGSSWNMSVTGGAGRLGTDGVDAYWVNGSNTGGTTTEVDYWTTPTNGDYQLVTMILGPRNSYGSIQLFARMDSTRTNYIKVNMTLTTLALSKVVGGAETPLGGTYTIPGGQSWKSGDVIQLTAGTSVDVRKFQVKRNGLIVIDQTDAAATLSLIGTSNRFAGLGVGAYTAASNIYQPGKIAAWSVADNQPPTVIGSGFRAYRTATGTTGMSAGNNQRMPASWFNSGTDYKSADITYTTASNRATFSIEGWYHVQVNLYGTGGIGIGGGGDVAAAIYKNGATSSTMAGPNVTGNINSGFQSPSGTFLIYLVAGDYLEPGWTSAAWGGGGNFWTGEGTGSRCWWSAALVNKSLL